MLIEKYALSHLPQFDLSGAGTLFGRRKSVSATEPGASIQLDALIATLGRATGELESAAEDAALVRARLADCCRDANVRPVSEAEFNNVWNGFDQEHQWRFCVLIAPLYLPEVGSRLAPLCQAARVASPVLKMLQELTTDHHLLTGSVLQQSDVRLEELARHFCAQWRLPIEGETADASETRRQQIDFRRLMKEAESARASADERLAYLRRLQEEEEKKRRPRRGKW